MAGAALPYPIARVYRGSRNATDAKAAHDDACFAWQASIELGVAARLPADPSALARATLGTWVQALSVPDLRVDDAALLRLHALLEGGGEAIPEPTRKSIHARELIDALPAYRNRVVGHGKGPGRRYYLAAAEVLLDGLQAAWRLGLFLPASRRLVYVHAVHCDAQGGYLADVFDLGGEVLELLHREGTPVPEAALAEKLYLLEGGATFHPLHPLLLFDFDPEVQRAAVFFFHKLARRAEYVDYSTGAQLDGAALEARFPNVTEELRRRLGVAADAGASAQEPAAPQDPSDLGAYRLLGKLGEGGMGVVYLAEQKSLGRRVALKMLREASLGDVAAHRRLQREMRALALCDHENVVKILDSGTLRGTPYYAMEFVDGVDLARVARNLTGKGSFQRALSAASEELRAELLERFPALPDFLRPPPERPAAEDRDRATARVIRDAARGLQHLHDLGIVHRDVSPGNVMVTATDGGRAVVTDLGLAAFGEQPSSMSRVTRALGTPLYTAPERLLEKGTVRDPRIDVYSLGAVLYELLADRPIFEAEGDEKRLQHQIVFREPAPPHRLRKECPRDLSVITQKATSKEPGERYASAAAMADDLDAWLEGRPITARPRSLSYELRLLVRRNRGSFATAGVTVLLLVLVVAAAFVSVNAARRSAEKNEIKALRREQELLRLSDGRELRLLKARMNALWPAYPDKLEAMKAWLGEARVLHGRLGEHAATLTSVRTQGRPLDMTDEPEPKIAELDGRLAALRSEREDEARERAVEEIDAEIAALEGERTKVAAEVATQRDLERDYDFGADAQSAWWHETLRELVIELRAFGADDPYGQTLASMEKRIEEASTIEERSTTGAAVATRWEAAISSIADKAQCPLYEGLRIAPQLSLVPLRQDPDSGLWEFWHVPTGEEPALDLETERWKITGATGLVFVLIPGGRYSLGAQSEDPNGPNYDRQAQPDEGIHDVVLAPYFLSKYEMTQGQWQRRSGVNPAWPHVLSEALDFPVQRVRWYQCDDLLRRTGLLLPTEAQWEAGCRARRPTPWWFGFDERAFERLGNVSDQSFARWFSAIDPITFGSWDDGWDSTAPPGTFPANPFGLHEVHGNVWEWCQDGYGPYEQVGLRIGDGLREVPGATLRLFRGGSFHDTAAYARSASRNFDTLEYRGNVLGVRPARSLD